MHFNLFLLSLLLGTEGRFQGYIEGEYVYVASPLGGTLTNLAVARGDAVQVGQLLFALERESEAAAVREAEHNLSQARAQWADLTKGRRPSEITSLQAQLERARADLKLSDAELVRRQDLLARNVVSAEELDQARSQRDADQAQVDQLAAGRPRGCGGCCPGLRGCPIQRAGPGALVV